MGRKALAAGRLWRYCLVAIGSASSFSYSPVPVVSFATLAGLTLSRRQAGIATVLVWIANQFYGFTVRYLFRYHAFLFVGSGYGVGNSCCCINCLHPAKV